MWLLIILKVSTPNVVDVWEAVMTFLFFPILVVVAYCADKGWMDFLMCKTCINKSSGLDAMDKQRQIELGTVQPGESTYRTNFQYCASTQNQSPAELTSMTFIPNDSLVPNTQLMRS